MGNATTFPVQSVVFACLAIAQIGFSLKVRPTPRRLSIVAQSVRVFGDDIIVPRTHSTGVISRLDSVGLRVNRTKSFSAGNFRESCGVEAYKGVDITPIYVKHFPTARNLKGGEQIEHLVALSNSCWERGLWRTATFLKDHVEDLMRIKFPLVRKNSGALGWTNFVDTYTAQKWCTNLQRFLVKAPTVYTPKKVDKIEGYPALLKFFVTSRNEDYRDPFDVLVTPKDHLEKSPVRFNSRIRMRWVTA
jgi:hypothetical protein